MLAATALIAATTLIAKALGLDTAGPPLHPLQISAGRFAFALAVLVAVAAWRRPSLAGAAWTVHAGRSACGWLGVTCMFAAAARIPLSDATAISFLSPLVTMALAMAFLRERVPAIRWLAAGIAVAGTIVLIRPGTEAFRPAALLALAAAAFMGLEMVLIKRLSDREPPLRILLINNTIGACLSCTAAMFVWTAPTTEQWLLLAALGGAMVTAQWLFIQSMRRATASYVAPFLYVTLVFAALYDFALFGTVPDVLAAAGAALIVAGMVLITTSGRKT